MNRRRYYYICHLLLSSGDIMTHFVSALSLNSHLHPSFSEFKNRVSRSWTRWSVIPRTSGPKLSLLLVGILQVGMTSQREGSLQRYAFHRTKRLT
ncbi:hypothetical protein BJY01DRAFT_66513 [Aspergillus pseudoustus]|uniref:Secreted protein n=1 Tax=Aspergillus pseudoustus TaxID=1810923 RepID=A0ABR4J9P9_9EURO